MKHRLTDPAALSTTKEPLPYPARNEWLVAAVREYQIVVRKGVDLRLPIIDLVRLILARLSNRLRSRNTPSTDPHLWVGELWGALR